MSIITQVNNAIAAVCPIDGVALVDPNNKATWRVDFQAVATPGQRAAAQSVIDNFNITLENARADKQSSLDLFFDTNLDLAKFIRGGIVTGVTGTNIGNFLAQITNNYRTLRTQIANAADVPTLNAININSGWPSNP